MKLSQDVLWSQQDRSCSHVGDMWCMLWVQNVILVTLKSLWRIYYLLSPGCDIDWYQCMYIAGHWWGIFRNLDVNWNVLQSCIFTYSVECKHINLSISINPSLPTPCFGKYAMGTYETKYALIGENIWMYLYVASFAIHNEKTREWIHSSWKRWLRKSRRYKRYMYQPSPYWQGSLGMNRSQHQKS